MTQKHRIAPLLASLLISVAPLQSASAQTVDPCEQECQSNNRREVGVCNTLYPPSSQVANHRACLDKARNTFDGCMSAC